MRGGWLLSSGHDGNGKEEVGGEAPLLLSNDIQESRLSTSLSLPRCQMVLSRPQKTGRLLPQEGQAAGGLEEAGWDRAR